MRAPRIAAVARADVAGESIVCAYHGWRYGNDGACVGVPAQPGAAAAAERAASAPTSAKERYGLVWACLGDAARATCCRSPSMTTRELRKVLCGPYDVACERAAHRRELPRHGALSVRARRHPGRPGAHRGEGLQGRARATTAPAGRGVIATGCWAWQPQTNSLSHAGSDVEYAYRVVRPLTAILDQAAASADGFREAISLHVQPLAEERSRAWIIMAMTNFARSEEDLRGFQDRIFLQDKPILENQRAAPPAARAARRDPGARRPPIGRLSDATFATSASPTVS